MTRNTFVEAFNAGYLLSKNDPKLLETILNVVPEGTEYSSGMRCGAEQSRNEKSADQIRVNKAIETRRDRDQGMDR